MDPFDLRLWNGFIKAGGDPSHSAIIDQVTIDSRRIDSKYSLFVPLVGNVFDGHNFVENAARAGAKYALVKQNWDPGKTIEGIHLLRVEDTLKAFQEISGVYRKQTSCLVVGITGSYGKTMVKDLLEEMIGTTKRVVASPESFNSQIGVPLSLLTLKKGHEIALIEAAISKRYEMDILSDIIAPDYGILTHIGKKHVATLGDLQTTAEETIKLLTRPKKDQWILIPKDPLLTPHLKQFSAVCHFWPEKNDLLPYAYFVNEERSAKMTYRVDFPDGKTHLGTITSGFYYFLDLINITLKAAWLLGIESQALSDTLKNYTPEPMRTEIWKSPVGTTFINDTYCSDPQSVDLSLKNLHLSPPQSRKIFVFGGMRGAKQHLETDYRRVGKAINRSPLNQLILVGDHPFQFLIEELTAQTEILQFKDYEEALNHMRTNVKPDDVILIKGEKKESLDRLTEAFNDSICNNQCMINLAAIESNLNLIRKKLAPDTRVMVMVKALAYGTDAVRMGQFLATCHVDILGVSYVDEGVALKRAGVSQSIFVINAAAYEAAKVVKWDLEVGVSEEDLINAIAREAAKQNKKIKLHLHVDTGMSRFGCRPEQVIALSKLILDSPFLQFDGIMTHFACADNPADDAFTLSQVRCFEEVIERLHNHGIHPKWKHAANSSATMRFHFPQFNLVRIGLAVYGLYSSEATRKAMELRLALSLVSRIVGINECKKGETISYGRSYTVEKDRQRIAVLPIGYFDGLHRNYSGKGLVIIRGQKAPMIGKICMDFMMVDITDIPNAAIGDMVLIFGEDDYGNYLSPEDLATRGDSIIHELITCLGPRIQRIFVHEETSHTH